MTWQQSFVPSIHPLLKISFHFSFAQIGMITLVHQAVASLLQPFVGYAAGRRKAPFLLSCGMLLILLGLLFLAAAGTLKMILFATSFIGVGSALFHPEASRVARCAAGGQHGLAPSLFQVGGNSASAIGPLLVAVIVFPRGQSSIAWFSVAALTATVLLVRVSKRLAYHGSIESAARAHDATRHRPTPPERIKTSIAILLALIFSKYVYLVSLTNYYSFYLIAKFHLSGTTSQIYLFVFLSAVAIGTFFGGPIGNRISAKYVIWCSILGVLPFTVAMPNAGLFCTVALSVVIGLTLSSAFSAIVVYAQELIPGRVGLIAGMFFGFAFGVAGASAPLIGKLADWTDICFAYRVCSFLPAIGLLAGLLPNPKKGYADAVAENLDGDSEHTRLLAPTDATG
jgi:MFS transporter, FSR family, fosmidomycin resistance protein